MCSSKSKLPNRAPLLERRNNSSAAYPEFLAPPIIRSKTTDDQPKARPTKSLNKSKSFSYSPMAAIMEYEAGSIAAARREQVASLHEQRKMRIAHYGRATKSKLLPPPPQDPPPLSNNINDKRCTFITPNSGTYLASTHPYYDIHSF